MKYKVRDRVLIKDLDWYNKNKDASGDVLCFYGVHKFTKEMSKFCGKTVTISTNLTGDGEYLIKEDDETNWWTDEMIEGLVEEEVFIKANDVYNEEYSKGEYCHEQSFKWGFQEGYNYSHENDKLEISLKEGYQFVDENGNIINATKIVLEKKGSRYPKTYEECSTINGCEGRISLSIIGKFTRLINARNAYWRIAGQEMGLRRPWEPDWTDDNAKYSIYTIKGALTKAISCYDGAILTFPTAEMRDAFYENFKELIEICKELL